MNSYILIGPIGSGKTEAQKIFQNLNIKCFCADNTVRKLYEDQEVISKINEIIPNSVKNGKIDKNIVREKIFTDEDKLKLIESYIHPKVFLEFENFKIKFNDQNILIFITPIIKSNNFLEKNNIIYINADKDIRINRLKKRKNYNKKIIENIMNYQESSDIYIKNYSHIIQNNGSLLQLKILIQQTLSYL
ncbi:MAG: dephospho-CoA kinase [Gammaproteobacteria bacterium]|nr:dephospho-CoA kinase [Gammaproteobacteria bacterium]MBT7523114.1 dephospho-CoA kinase [Gammaproteobacteria bacterium]